MARAPWGKIAPAQGGFVVARPDLDTFEALCAVVRAGDFRAGSGWAGTGVGSFYGGMTIQGLVPYFFEMVRPGAGVAVDNCVYNNMANNPRSVGGFGKGVCRDGSPADDCKDCRLVDVATVKTVHFTICQKPWGCFDARNQRCPYCPICTKFHRLWFEAREAMEREWGIYEPYTGDAPERHGMCGRHRDGSRGYKPVPIDRLVNTRAGGSSPDSGPPPPSRRRRAPLGGDGGSAGSQPETPPGVFQLTNETHRRLRSRTSRRRHSGRPADPRRPRRHLR
mmetsp:Transcript_26264/g.105098  ORF Transcript_26264/g.105098 Transcript_26264/m.105098 type:complete len:279 (+) Transcript_26264:1353-2189(+)